MEPFLRPTSAFGVLARPTPDGWTAHPVGRWRDRPVEVVYDPRRYDVALVRGIAPSVAANLASAGWCRRGSDGSQECWVRDRVAAAKRRLQYPSTASPSLGVAR